MDKLALFTDKKTRIVGGHVVPQRKIYNRFLLLKKGLFSRTERGGKNCRNETHI